MDRAPLSFAQERLWFLDQLAPGRATYNVARALRLRGLLVPEALHSSLQGIVRRHAALRTRFLVDEGGVPYQVADEHGAPAFRAIDLGAAPADERAAEERRLFADEAARPFDLSTGPLLRATLVRLADDESVLLLVVHHIAFDGWSLAVFLRELQAFYEASVTGGQPLLPPLPMQYADLASAQRQALRGSALEDLLRYWREHLHGAADALDLPADRPRPSMSSYRGARASITLPAALTTGLRRLAGTQRASLFMGLIATLKALLFRYTGQADISVGSPVANRMDPGVAGLIGFVANTIVLRTRLSGATSFRTLLNDVRATCLDAYAHEGLPFEKLVEELNPHRDTSRNPLFQVLFELQSSLPTRLGLPGLHVEVEEVEAGAAKVDLAFSAADSGDGVRLACHYATDLFDAATVERMLAHYQMLLAGVLAAPDQPLRALPLLSPQEAVEIARASAAEARYQGDPTLAGLITAGLSRAPAAPAVCFGEEVLTRGELDRRANQLAHALRARGVRAESRVGVCLERSLELMVALVGTLKAGAAYVPLDPSHPRDRLRAVVEDSRIEWILTQSHLRDRVPDAPGVLSLDDAALLAGQPDQALESGSLHPETLAYVIYTSGSTGRPKGAMNTHRAVRNRLLWMIQQYEMDESDVFLQKTPFGFDVSVWELFCPLICGGTLVMAKPGGHQENAYLLDLIARHRVTFVHFVPPMLQAFLEEERLEACRSLRHVVCSGEALPAALRDAFHARLAPAPQLHNLYGPTEAAVDVTYWPCARDDADRSVPIGRPIANVEIHVLDGDGNVLPIGIPGELHIGGVALARGYEGAADATAERFVPSPFVAAPGARLYRTGDRARRRADGAIEFLGRLDHQVKLRGLRIELGEIEWALAQHETVREAVVTVRDEPSGDRRLVAHIVPKPGAAPAAAALREHLRDRLPEHMVPAAFVFVTALPLSANGKVDRKRLPAPGTPDAGASAAPALQDETEAAIAAAWCQVLGLPRVGPKDNFFDLGGHSLLMVRLRTRLSKTFQRDISMVELFRHPTVRSLARYLRGDDSMALALEAVEQRARRQREAYRDRRERFHERKKARIHEQRD